MLDNRCKESVQVGNSKKKPASKRASGPTTRSETIAVKLRGAILAGEFAPGERMFELELSEKLKVSRTPIREALKSLAGEGLLDHVPNRGYYVRAYSVDDIVEAYEIRAALEGLATARGAARSRGATRSSRRLEDVRPSKKGTSPRAIAFSMEDQCRLHSAILAGSQSRMLRDQLRLSQQIAPSSHRNIIAFERRDVRRRHDDHYRIYEAILCRDSGRAER